MYYIIFSSLLLFFTPMLETVASAEPVGADDGAKPPSYDVGPHKLIDQLSEIASIPEFQLNEAAIERAFGVQLEPDGPPPQGIPELTSEQSHFGPNKRHPYELSWEKTDKFTQFDLVWHEYGKKYLPFQRAPAGMCIQAKTLAKSFVDEGWRLHYSARFSPSPPSDTYTKGEHGYLRLVFDRSTECVIQVLLVATLMKWD